MTTWSQDTIHVTPFHSYTHQERRDAWKIGQSTKRRTEWSISVYPAFGTSTRRSTTAGPVFQLHGWYARYMEMGGGGGRILVTNPEYFDCHLLELRATRSAEIVGRGRGRGVKLISKAQRTAHVLVTPLHTTPVNTRD